MVLRILNLEGQYNCMISSIVKTILTMLQMTCDLWHVTKKSAKKSLEMPKNANWSLKKCLLVQKSVKKAGFHNMGATRTCRESWCPLYAELLNNQVLEDMHWIIVSHPCYQWTIASLQERESEREREVHFSWKTMTLWGNPANPGLIGSHRLL